MAAKAKSPAGVEVSAAARGLGAQFRQARQDSNDPSSWPSIPKYLLYLFVIIMVAGALWYLWVSNSDAEYKAAQATEESLRNDYKTKVQRAVSLEELKKQKAQVQQYVSLLEKQLPSKSEMDALLSDINQAGLGRSLQFELFKPSPPVTLEYYMEQPIALKVTGRYHDIGAFTADVAALSRIVTLNNISLSPAPVGSKGSVPDALVMEATAKTFRYLDPDDPEDQAALQAAKNKNQRGGAR
jgi:type IV pilus assembly protein PilO